MRVVVWLRALRLPFLGASLLPLTAGFLFARELDGRPQQPVPVLLSFLGLASLHLGANLINDWFDSRSGTDARNTNRNAPFTGGSRVIQEGLISPAGMLAASCCCFVVATLSGLFLTHHTGPGILLFGLLGLLSGIGYSAFFVRWYIGEALAGLSFGLLTVAGAVYVHKGLVLLAVLPVGFLLSLPVTMILWVNQFPDYEADRASGKRNLVVRLGRRRAARIFPFFVGMLFLVLTFVAIRYRLYALGAGILLLPGAIRMSRILSAHHDDPSGLLPVHGAAIRLHNGVSFLLIASLACKRGGPVLAVAVGVLFCLVLVLEAADVRKYAQAGG